MLIYCDLKWYSAKFTEPIILFFKRKYYTKWPDK